MTTPKVFIVITQVLLLCACSSVNRSARLESDSDVSDTSAADENCVLDSSDNLDDQTRSMAEDVCRRTNQARTEQALAPLKLELNLSEVAQAHSQDMTDRAFFSHTNPDDESPFDRLTEAGITYQYAAENIASGQTSAEEVVNAWLNSSAHRSNILSSRFTRLGVGVSGTYWTQVFTDSD